MANCNFPQFGVNQTPDLFPQPQGAPAYTTPAPLVQNFFPQPQGSIFMISRAQEVNNVPVGNGIAAAICLQESLMFLKTIQNGVPVSVAYRLAPFDTVTVPVEDNEPTLQDLAKKLQALEERFKKSGGKAGEWLV